MIALIAPDTPRNLIRRFRDFERLITCLAEMSSTDEV